MFNFLKKTLLSGFLKKGFLIVVLWRVPQCSLCSSGSCYTPAPHAGIADVHCHTQLQVCFARSCPAALIVPWRLSDHFRILFCCCARGMISTLRIGGRLVCGSSAPSTILREQAVFLIPRYTCCAGLNSKKSSQHGYKRLKFDLPPG